LKPLDGRTPIDVVALARRPPGTPLKLATLETIGYAMAAFLAIGFCETALAIEDSNNGI
jgi:hypothetical protein